MPGLVGFIFALCTVSSVMAQNTIHLQVTSLPAYHPSGSIIYVAGSFNGWNPQDENYKFTQGENGQYTITLSLDQGPHEFKLTRGGWDKAECLKGGESMANRRLEVVGPQVENIKVEEWLDRLPARPKKSTASPNVKIIDTAFLIPQLKRTRRIWIYLPECYDQCSKRFPVIYMQDGQNLFDESTSYTGEWGVDKYLDSLGSTANQSIIVGIDNGSTKRLNEYSPYDVSVKAASGVASRYKGEGDLYVDFLVKTLKPYIDKNYRTAKNKANTAIAGSSMGALISMYAMLKYPRVFGAAGIFSPAFWLVPGIFDDIKKKGKKVSSNLYFYAGKLESPTLVTDMLKAYEAMSIHGKAKMQAVIRDEGKHDEATWRKEFPLFYQWINTK
ncbi:MAG: alpha/beta hydrolase [Chitinophagaceae bacterium]|nr:MAG: alpha/beta hydrolase [Chitinophagaceae bacterium]